MALQKMQRFIYTLVHPFVGWYRLLRGKNHERRGIKCIIEHDGTMLLIRNAYANPDTWTFPGGKSLSGEALEETVRREVKEEVGIIIETMTRLETLPEEKNMVHYFFALTDSPTLSINHAEVGEAMWFPKSTLPEPTASFVKKRFEKYAASVVALQEN